MVHKMSSSDNEKNAASNLLITSPKSALPRNSVEQLGELFLEKFIALNPLYLIDEYDDDYEEKESFIDSSSMKSDFSLDF